MLQQVLDGKWRFRRVNESEWLTANVPGSVFHDLFVNGKIEDPFYGENELEAPEIASYDYEYEREFAVGGDLQACEKVYLLCEGLDTLAELFINGHFTVSSNNMHRTCEVDIKNLIHEGNNRIRIVFHSPVKYIEQKQKENPLWGPEETMAGFPHIRKGHSMFGWDWGPEIPDMGIWRSISLLGCGKERLHDIYITQSHQEGRVGLDIRVRLDIGVKPVSAVPGGKLRLRAVLTAPDGSSIEQTIHVKHAEEHIRIEIEHPELWWPNGYGSQPLYHVRTELLHMEERQKSAGKSQGELPEGGAQHGEQCGTASNGAVRLDEKSFDIGLRTIRVKRQKDQWGESFAFEINGVAIFAMGADYIPEDSLLSRCSKVRTERLIKSCVAANFNCIRVWGGGCYCEDYFYELCDRYGLLVWQDFMFACAVYELTDEFAENIRKEAEDNILRIRNHTSLALWCGNNEMETAWVDWSFPKTEEHRRQYLKMFEEILPHAVTEFDPNTFYWPSSPSSGGGFEKPNDENNGDVHYWEVWHGLKPFTDYRKYYFRFVSEFGFQSFPGMKTIKSFTEPEDRNIFSCVMENHQKNGAANGKILYYLSDYFKYPKNFDSLLYTSQLLQAEAIKYGVEHWRRYRGRCMGTIYWQLNDCWPVASWASIDYFGRWKALHYFAARFFTPVLLSAFENGLKVSLHVSNESLQPVRGEIRWKLRDQFSRVLREGGVSAGTGPLSSECVCELDFENELSDRRARRTAYLEFALYCGDDCVSGGTVLFVRNKHFEFTDPQIDVTVRESEDAYEIALASKAYARYVGLDLENSDCIFSDNYFDLSAGEQKLIKAKKENFSEPLSLEEFKKQLQVRSIVDLYE